MRNVIILPKGWHKPGIDDKIMTKKDKNKLNTDEIQRCITVLNHLVEKSEHLTELPEKQRIALLIAAGKLSRPDPDEKKKRQKEIKKAKRRKKTENEREARAARGIRSARTADVFMI